MTLDAALERFRVAEAASDIEATDEAARAVLEADDARREVEAARARAEARAAVMSALAAAAETTDKTDRDKALAKLDPKARAVFLETAPERPSLLDEAGDDWTPTPPARPGMVDSGMVASGPRGDVHGRRFGREIEACGTGGGGNREREWRMAPRSSGAIDPDRTGRGGVRIMGG